MVESQFNPDQPSLIAPILEQLTSVGYDVSRSSDLSAAEKIAGGLVWCVSVLSATGPEFDVVLDETRNLESEMHNGEAGKGVEEALRLLGCPHPLVASQIQSLDYEGIFPVVHWITNRIQTTQDNCMDEVTCTEHFLVEEHTFQQLEEELRNTKESTNTLDANLREQNQRKVNVLTEMQHLQEKIREGPKPMVPRLVSSMKLLKALEKQVSDFQSHCNEKQSGLQAKIIELEEKILSGSNSKNLLSDLNNSLCESLGKLNSAKRELGARLRGILLLKCQLDDVPSQTELIQYERRFSELYVHIQEKLRKTRIYYATYNALLEMKELMLKETSLLNSVSLQFQDAITTSIGRMKLIDSMEGIVKGTQQKLEKVQLALQAEQKACDSLKERYAVAIAEQRQCYSLLKAFQEECAKNERLRSLHSA
ncbi:uncharacterized protein LOC131151898 [Malania oleifera]|uniref:uncharacterized protein LOC131151898 n=1 Tax=Malania oleifera TaxID=397392 RepID=UPI0025AE3650|nr:uncharacterized protein LOC131151898 [Malania oleifera]